jgi:hypothetical protein
MMIEMSFYIIFSANIYTNGVASLILLVFIGNGMFNFPINRFMK